MDLGGLLKAWLSKDLPAPLRELVDTLAHALSGDIATRVKSDGTALVEKLRPILTPPAAFLDASLETLFDVVKEAAALAVDIAGGALDLFAQLLEAGLAFVVTLLEAPLPLGPLGELAQKLGLSTDVLGIVSLLAGELLSGVHRALTGKDFLVQGEAERLLALSGAQMPWVQVPDLSVRATTGGDAIPAAAASVRAATAVSFSKPGNLVTEEQRRFFQIASYIGGATAVLATWVGSLLTTVSGAADALDDSFVAGDAGAGATVVGLLALLATVPNPVIFDDWGMWVFEAGIWSFQMLQGVVFGVASLAAAEDGLLDLLLPALQYLAGAVNLVAFVGLLAVEEVKSVQGASGAGDIALATVQNLEEFGQNALSLVPSFTPMLKYVQLILEVPVEAFRPILDYESMNGSNLIAAIRLAASIADDVMHKAR